MITKNNRKIRTSGILGIAAGFLLCAVIMFKAMPLLMIVTRQSKLGFNETVAALEKRIFKHGWVVSGSKPIDMNKSMAKHKVTFKPHVRLVKLCKPEYVKSVLTTA